MSKVAAQFLKPLARNDFPISATLAFPELLKTLKIVMITRMFHMTSSLYSQVYLLKKLLITSYINSIEPMCKKLIFKKLLIKLTKECTVSVNNQLIKQTDGSPMGVPISVLFADIYMCKMEDVVAPLKPIFCKRYVDDTYVRRKKNATDELFENLNTYQNNITLTIEQNPTEILDAEIKRNNSAIITKIYTRSNKFHVHWSSKMPLRYKCNTITGELHRANKIASNFSNETKRIKIKNLLAGFPSLVINDIFHRLNQQKEEVLIPQ